MRFPAIVAAALVAACSTKSYGTSLGTFTVTGNMSSNTCGTTLGAPNPWTFDVVLSKDGTTLYWKQGAAPIGTTLGTDSKATFSITTTATPRAATSTNVGCAMTRVDSMPIALSLEPQPLSFTGALSYSFSVTSGSDCTDQLTSSGGTYDVLPCAVAYDLTATRTKAP